MPPRRIRPRQNGPHGGPNAADADDILARSEAGIFLSRGLLIVESPAKAKTIEKFLGRRFAVAASMGHVRDLPRSQLGVAADDGFQPRYITIRGKGPVLAELREKVKKADRVLLATDPDREGEAISWHLCQALGLPEDGPVRITFQEITQDAVQRALKSPRPIDHQLVLAQQARRVLDRLVGYKLSPLLWKKVRGGLSAGRVQSVAVRLIVDREQERQRFEPVEYWSLLAALSTDSARAPFGARYYGVGSGRVELGDKAQVDGIMAAVQGKPFHVVRVTKRERRRNPAPPFTTASLQQEASRKLGFGVARTMRIAQQLYEGLDVGGEHLGLVTYIRTDSVRVADQAQAEAADYVKSRWGQGFAFPRAGSARAGAQDAHEAIRPTSVLRTPDSLTGVVSRDQLRVYRLVWERFLASQMAAAVYDTVTADIVAGKAGPAAADGELTVPEDAHIFRATGSTIKFAGFMTLYVEGKDEAPAEGDEDEERILPELVVGEKLSLLGLEPAQHFTEPPPRFTEAMLVRALEEQGIGRPSTYAPIIETIQQRGYVGREDRRLHPTELGVVVTDLLKEYFPTVVDVAFTAGMEGELDSVESGELDWQTVVGEFYQPFSAMLERAEIEIGKVELEEDTVTDEVCEVCGKPMAVRHGRFGAFLACTGYPECKHTRPILQKTGVLCPRCGGELVVRRSRRGRTFYGCARYPDCDFVAWQRPVGPCPVCGDLMVEKRGREGARWAQCINPQCDHREGLEGDSVVLQGGAVGSSTVAEGGASVPARRVAAASPAGGGSARAGARSGSGGSGSARGAARKTAAADRGSAGSRKDAASKSTRKAAGNSPAAGGAGARKAGAAPRSKSSSAAASGSSARRTGAGAKAASKPRKPASTARASAGAGAGGARGLSASSPARTRGRPAARSRTKADQ